MSDSHFHDPVVAEIHAIREQMLAECDGDLGRLLAKARITALDFQKRLTETPFAPSAAAQSKRITEGANP